MSSGSIRKYLSLIITCQSSIGMALIEIEYRPEITYYCDECETKFLFIHEITSHLEMFGHDQIAELPMG
jgi:hypothetical protein